MLVGGIGLAMPFFIAAVVAASPCVRHRPMTAQEQAFAREVFGSSLPVGGRIVLTDLAGLVAAASCALPWTGRSW